MGLDGSTPGAGSERRIRLLVVDDDDGIRTLLEVSISLDARFELVGTAASGEEALALARGAAADASGLDVVLLDVTLPDRDGIELVGDLRGIAPEAHVALFTGWSDEDTFQRAAQAGADAVFGKDGDPRGLLDGIAELCSA